MKLLALDTSSVACTVAVQIGEQVFTRHAEQPREHTRLLMPMIRSVLADADLGLCDLDGIVLGNGPGSFIGMRIAAAVAQGLAFGAGLKIAPVSSLAAVAAEVGSSGPAHVAVAQDAHMQEVYLGLYELNDGAVSATVPERLQRCEAIAELGDRGLRPHETVRFRADPTVRRDTSGLHSRVDARLPTGTDGGGARPPRPALRRCRGLRPRYRAARRRYPGHPLRVGGAVAVKLRTEKN